MNVSSVKDRLRNYARVVNKPYQEILTYYALERTIYRLSVSDYADHFVLKGGIFLYAIHDKDYSRATTDIDIMAQKMTNDAVKMHQIFAEILSIESDDALTYDLDTLKVTNITEFKEYHGLNVSVLSMLEKSKIRITIDIGYDDVIVPGKVKMTYPTILELNAPEVFAYSLESVIAEKFEAIVANGLLNSRYKDFYDICMLARENKFDGRQLASAIEETFSHRHTALSSEVSAFGEEFYGDSINQMRWEAFLKKKKAMLPISLKETVLTNSRFLMPLVKKLLSGENVEGICWDNQTSDWIEKTEDEYDLVEAERAYAEYKIDPVAYSLDELEKMLDKK